MLASLLALVLPLVQTDPGDDYLKIARDKLAAGDTAAARAAIDAALERDEFSLEALDLKARVAAAQGDNDACVHALHELIEIARHAGRDAAALARSASDRLQPLDPDASTWEKVKSRYVNELLQIAAEHEKKERMHSALELFAHARAVDPHDPRTGEGVQRVRKTGGADVAVADVFAGGDPTFGKSEEWVAKGDRAHAEWKSAWTHESDNYKYRTNAGYRVLMTSAIAMENVNRFYRRFFDYKTKGEKIAKIEIRIFKNRDEYLSLGRNPAPWSGGHFIGDAVETFVGGVTGNESIRRMYGTLFHEAAHHFVSLTSPRCPGWLNEAFASFFEGCEMLSNGSVRWNRVPSHRLFPLAARMESGWMSGPEDGIAADGTGEPERAPTFRTVVEGKYRWGPPWYAPTWGVVYFLHNYRDASGIPVYRAALQEYYRSFKGKQPRDAVEHFETTVLGAKRSQVRTIDALDPVWKQWILELRDYEQGQADRAAALLAAADALLAKKDDAAALELLDDAYVADPSNPEVLARLAALSERRNENDRAAALYRELADELEARGLAEQDARYGPAREKAEKLDPLALRYARLNERTSKDGLALARRYEERGLPTMALWVLRRMSAQFSIPEALDLYREIALKTGKTLARWKLAYNERDLTGWSDDGSGSYQAYGREIRAKVADDPSQTKGEGAFTTRTLACDVAFEADFNLEAEIWIESGKARVAGLTFGCKDETTFLAVLLHPKGFLDLSWSKGGTWQVLDHREAPLAKGWHKLRIDVAGENLDFYLDGRWVRTFPFASSDVLRGGFGLITGAGECAYRHVRLLARDAHDPAARIERELLMRRIAQDETLRTSDTFAGFAPPSLEGGDWAHGEPVDPRAPGAVSVLFFWNKDVERQMPSIAYAKHLAREHGSRVLRVVLIAGGERASGLRPLLGDDLPPHLHALGDRKREVLARYGIKQGGFGLPRLVLVDIDGKVVFEGDLGLRAPDGWKPGTKTYADEPLARLVEERKLKELAAMLPQLGEAKALLDPGRPEGAEIERAVKLLRPLAELGVAAAPAVHEAGRVLSALREKLEREVAGAEQAATDWPLKTERLLAEVAAAFPGDPLAKRASAALTKLRKTRELRLAHAAAKHLAKAREYVAASRDAQDVRAWLSRARKASDAREIAEAIARIEAQLQ